ncbi:MAG: sigma-70 family RNA polymerase sigma factor [Pseudomonadota bacterium]
MNRTRPQDFPPVRDASRDDILLLERIAEQDTAAFRTLYLTYHKRLSRFLLRFVRQHDIVEEIINDTLYVVWRKASEFRGESQVSTWILGIAYRQALKALKKSAVNPLIDSSVDPESVAALHDAGASQRETREWINRGLAALPPVQRMVIELAYFMGHSCEEIAVITDSPVNTVKTRMFHAREKLRGLLQQLPGSAPAE